MPFPSPAFLYCLTHRPLYNPSVLPCGAKTASKQTKLMIPLRRRHAPPLCIAQRRQIRFYQQRKLVRTIQAKLPHFCTWAQHRNEKQERRRCKDDQPLQGHCLGCCGSKTDSSTVLPLRRASTTSAELPSKSTASLRSGLTVFTPCC